MSPRTEKSLYFKAVKDIMVKLLKQPVGKSAKRIRDFRKAIGPDNDAFLHDDPYNIAYHFVYQCKGPDDLQEYFQEMSNWYQKNRKGYRKIMCRYYGKSVLRFI